MILAEYASTVEHLRGLHYIRWWHMDTLGDLRIRRLPDDMKGVFPYVLALAAASDYAPGALVDDDGTPLSAADIARDIAFNPAVVKRFITTAQTRGLISSMDDGTLYFPTFVDRQIAKRDVEKSLKLSENARAAAFKRHAKDAARARANADANARANGGANADA